MQSMIEKPSNEAPKKIPEATIEAVINWFRKQLNGGLLYERDFNKLKGEYKKDWYDRILILDEEPSKAQDIDFRTIGLLQKNWKLIAYWRTTDHKDRSDPFKIKSHSIDIYDDGEVEQLSKKLSKANKFSKNKELISKIALKYNCDPNNDAHLFYKLRFRVTSRGSKDPDYENKINIFCDTLKGLLKQNDFETALSQNGRTSIEVYENRWYDTLVLQFDYQPYGLYLTEACEKSGILDLIFPVNSLPISIIENGDVIVHYGIDNCETIFDYDEYSEKNKKEILEIEKTSSSSRAVTDFFAHQEKNSKQQDNEKKRKLSDSDSGDEEAKNAKKQKLEEHDEIANKDKGNNFVTFGK